MPDRDLWNRRPIRDIFAAPGSVRDIPDVFATPSPKRDISDIFTTPGRPWEGETNPLLQKIGYYGAGALGKTLEPLEWMGRGMYETFKGDPLWKDTRKKLEWKLPTPEEREEKDIRIQEEYEALPEWERMLWETPGYLALATVTPSAGSIRAALAPAAARGGIRGGAALATRGALAPLAAVEKGTGILIKGAIQLPLRGISTGARKAFDFALNKGLDKILVREGIRGDQANKVLAYFLKWNERKVFNYAENNLLKRVHPKMTQSAAEKAAAQAADDTVKQIEPLLLQASKDIGVKPPTIKPAEVKMPFAVEDIPLAPTSQAYKPTFPLAKKYTFYKAMDVAPEATAVQAYGEGFYVASTREGAEFWGTDVEPIEATIKKPLIVPADSDLFETALRAGYVGEEPTMDRIIEWAKKEGYDAIVGKSLHEGLDHINIINREVITKMPEPGMATNTQKVEAHRIAFNKQLINPKTNKVRPQYRRLAKAMTGKTSMTKMTEAEADTFIEALGKLPLPTMMGARIKPPTIPLKKKIVGEEFFAKMKFGEPTPLKYITSQTYYAQKLGVKPLVEDLEIGKQTIDIEYPKLAKAVEQKINQINKIAGTSVKEKIAAKIKNRPTEAVKNMRDLLNKFEEAPVELSPKERELFEWFRELNRTTLEAENKVRASLGIEEIPYRQAYVRHIADKQAWEVLEGQRGLPPDLEYWSKRIVGKRVYNPMEMQRQLADDLEAYFTKDLEYATKSMLWTALREIHLSQPLATFNEQMAAFSKELPVYEGLTGVELEQAQKVSIMPASTRKWVTDYVNIVLKGQQTETDAMINRIVTQSGLGGIFDKILKPFGRSVGQQPVTKLAQFSGRLIISATIGPRPKLINRNLWQNNQNIALYGVLNATKALFPAPKLCKELMAESLFLQGYARVEELPNSAMGVMERLWMAAYGKSAIYNAGNGMKAAYYDTLDLITNPKYKEYGWADPARTYAEPKNFVYPSERARLLREMEFGSGATQYQYIAMAMPEIFRHKTLIPATRLQSWWMNYFAKFHREALHRFIKGETSYGGKLPWNRRVNWLKYMILGGAILTSMGYKRSYMTGVLPFYMSPGIQVAIGMYNYLLAPNDWQREKAKRQMFYSWRAFVPGSLAWKDFNDVWSGERPLSTLFFYTEDWPPHKPTWGIPALEAKDAYEQVESQIWSQYPGLKPKSDAIKELEKTDPAKARKMLYEDPDGAEILEARRLIAIAHNELKRKEAIEEREKAMAER